MSDRLAREVPGAWKPDQYSNPEGPASHYATTGPELWEQSGHALDAIVVARTVDDTDNARGRGLGDLDSIWTADQVGQAERRRPPGRKVKKRPRQQNCQDDGPQ